MAENRLQFEIDVRDIASEKIRLLERRIESLGGQAAVDATKKLNQLEREARSLEKAAGAAEPTWTRFTTGIALGNIAANAAAAGLSALRSAMSSVIDKTVEADRAQNRLNASLVKAGISSRDTQYSLTQYATQLMESVGQSDEAIKLSMSRFIDFGFSAKSAMSLVATAADVAAAQSIDLESATNMLIKAGEGAARGLSAYGIKIKENLPPMEQMRDLQRQINEVMGGTAKANMEGMAGAVSRLGIAWDEFLESVGKGKGVGTISGWLADFLNFARDSRISILDLTPAMMGMTTMMYKAGLDGVQPLSASFETLALKSMQAKQHIRELLAALPQGNTTQMLGYPSVDLMDSVKRFEDQQKQDAEILLAKNKELTAEYYAQNDAQLRMYATSGAAQQRILKTLTAVEEKIKKQSILARQIGDNLAWSMQSAVSNMLWQLDVFADNARITFKGMAQDFINYFIRSSLESLAVNFIGSIGGGGILGLLGSIFDTPANDRMAMREGSRFAMFFSKGALGGLNGMAPAFAGSAAGSWGGYNASTSPAITYAPRPQSAPRGGDTNIYITVQGSLVTEQDLMTKVIIPQTEKRIELGNSTIVKGSGLLTGGRA